MANPQLLYYPCVTGNLGACSNMYTAISADAVSLNALIPVWQDLILKKNMKAGDVVLLTYPDTTIPGTVAWFVSMIQLNADGSHQTFSTTP
jgi:hypothetical protein